MSLADKNCIPCQGGVSPFTKKQIDQYLPQLKHKWAVIENNKKIRLSFKTKDFKSAIDIINQAAGIAEKEYHHPDIAITKYNHITFTIYTHKINGLWESDFILAAKLEQLVP